MTHEAKNCDHRREAIEQLKALLDELADDTPPKRSPIPSGRPCGIQMDSKNGIPPPDVMVCYKCKNETNDKQKNDKQSKFDSDLKPKGDAAPVQTCKSRELLGGVLYLGCDCCKKNGLQDECRRTQCQGSPACLTKPEPTCCPSQYSNAKHLMSKMFKNENTGSRGNTGGSKIEGGSGNNVNNATVEKYICYPAVVQCCDCD